MAGQAAVMLTRKEVSSICKKIESGSKSTGHANPMKMSKMKESK
jgi:hypothetical protein